MGQYRVVQGSLKVATTEQSYTPDEDVMLHIECTVERKDGLGAVFVWEVVYQIFDKGWKLIKEFTRAKSMAPWQDIDTAVEDFDVSIGRYSPGLLEGYVVVSARG